MSSTPEVIPDNYESQGDLISRLLNGKTLRKVVRENYCSDFAKLGKKHSNMKMMYGGGLFLSASALVLGGQFDRPIISVLAILGAMICAFLFGKRLYTKQFEPNYIEFCNGTITPEFKNLLDYFDKLRNSSLPIFRADGFNRMGVKLPLQVYMSKFGLLALIGTENQKGGIDYRYINPNGEWWLPILETFKYPLEEQNTHNHGLLQKLIEHPNKSEAIKLAKLLAAHATKEKTLKSRKARTRWFDIIRLTIHHRETTNNATREMQVRQAMAKRNIARDPQSPLVAISRHFSYIKAENVLADYIKHPEFKNNQLAQTLLSM